MPLPGPPRRKTTVTVEGEKRGAWEVIFWRRVWRAWAWVCVVVVVVDVGVDVVVEVIVALWLWWYQRAT